jgi:hypothetical protein
MRAGFEQRARRLMRWYPPSWRESHADEFQALLEDSMTERPFSLHRGIDIAFKGTQERLFELDRNVAANLGDRPTARIEIGRLSSIDFWIYTLVFASLALTRLFGHGFEAGVAPGALVVGSMLVVLGALAAVAGIAWAVVGRSIRRSWPLITLGCSLAALVAADLAQSIRSWRVAGWEVVDHLLLGLWPAAWFSTPGYPAGIVPPHPSAAVLAAQSRAESYVWLNLSLGLLLASSLLALLRRRRPSAVERGLWRTRIADGSPLLIVAASWAWTAAPVSFWGYHLAGTGGTLLGHYSLAVVLSVSGAARWLVRRSTRLRLSPS